MIIKDYAALRSRLLDAAQIYLDNKSHGKVGENRAIRLQRYVKNLGKDQELELLTVCYALFGPHVQLNENEGNLLKKVLNFFSPTDQRPRILAIDVAYSLIEGSMKVDNYGADDQFEVQNGTTQLKIPENGKLATNSLKTDVFSDEALESELNSDFNFTPEGGGQGVHSTISKFNTLKAVKGLVDRALMELDSEAELTVKSNAIELQKSWLDDSSDMELGNVKPMTDEDKENIRKRPGDGNRS